MNSCPPILPHTDWLTLLAIVVGPAIAIAGQLWYQRRKERRDAKMGVFRVLMSFRNAQLSPDFVTALNMIDLVFYESTAVRERWQTMWEFLDDKRNFDLPRANEKIEMQRDLLAQLLSTMASELSLKFDHTMLKNGAYRPEYHNEEQAEQIALRKSLLGALTNNGRINVKLVEDPPTPVLPAVPRIGPSLFNR